MDFLSEITMVSVVYVQYWEGQKLENGGKRYVLSVESNHARLADFV